MAARVEIKTVELEIIEAGCCGSYVAMTAAQKRHFIKTGEGWTCLNGHSRVFNAESDDKLKAEIAKRDRELEFWKTDNGRLSDSLGRTKRQLKAQKGQATRLRNRIIAGICTLGCNRHFKDLEQHNETKHPEVKRQ